MAAAWAVEGEEIAARAEAWVGGVPPRDDCSGLVEAIAADLDLDLHGTVRTFWEEARAVGRIHHHRPDIGDLAFFDRTYDADHDGRADDDLTHVAVVVDVGDDGTIALVHRGGAGVTRFRMNLDHPDEARVDGVVVNDYLARPGYLPDRERLAGQRWVGFVRLADEAPIAHRPPSRRAPERTVVPAPAPVASRPARSARAAAPARAATPLPTRAARIDAPPDSPARAASPGPAVVAPERGAVARVIRGDRLGRAEVSALDCRGLWEVRNAIVASHGYTFTHPDTRALFEGRPWYHADPFVSAGTIDELLDAADRDNLARVQATEAARGCRAPRRP